MTPEDISVPGHKMRRRCQTQRASNRRVERYHKSMPVTANLSRIAKHRPFKRGDTHKWARPVIPDFAKLCESVMAPRRSREGRAKREINNHAILVGYKVSIRLVRYNCSYLLVKRE